MKKMIELDNVTKQFKGEAVIDKINLELFDNKIYGFTGRNGSGKSVLMKIIGGFIKPDSGRVIVKGRELSKGYDFPDGLGALIENPGFLWYDTGFNNLLYLARIRKMINKEDIRNAMISVGLDPNSKKKVGRYSLGMKQRLGIAQAIMENPDILLLDEPMNGLDENGVDIVRNMLLKKRGEGVVIIISSHNREDISILCDEVYNINAGSIKTVL